MRLLKEGPPLVLIIIYHNISVDTYVYIWSMVVAKYTTYSKAHFYATNKTKYAKILHTQIQNSSPSLDGGQK